MLLVTVPDQSVVILLASCAAALQSTAVPTAPQALVIAVRVSVANAMAMRRRGGVISVPFVVVETRRQYDRILDCRLHPTNTNRIKWA
jgi:hypothetical protein